MKINDIMNVIIEFELEGKSNFFGIFMFEKRNIYLNCRVSEKQYKLLEFGNLIRGSFGQNKITISNYYIKKTSYPYKEMYCEVTLVPDEIIIGDNFFENTKIKKVQMDIERLNYFSAQSPLVLNPEFSKDNPSVVNFTCPSIVKYNNGQYSFSLYYGFSENMSKDGIRLENIPTVEMDFKEMAECKESIKTMAMIRMLFTFLADYYIPLGKIILYGNENERYLYHMNYIDEIEVGFKFFIIDLEMIYSDFGSILERWIEFYQKNTCIVELFYEIISNRSIGINQFLNLSQAIEVYSRRYRELEVKQTYKYFKEKDFENNKKCALFHRVYDIFSLFNYIFKFSDEEIEEIARLISNIRNYYTHYDEKRASCIERGNVYILNKCMRFILLSIVYKEIGIDEDIICEAMNTTKYGEIKSNIIKIIKKK